MVGHGKGPGIVLGDIVHDHMAMACVGEGVFQRVDHQFSDDQTQTDRNLAADRHGIDARRDRQLAMVIDHRGPQTGTKLRQIGRQIHRPAPGFGLLPLQRRKGHHALVGIAQMRADLLRLAATRALRQDAGDDLQTLATRCCTSCSRVELWWSKSFCTCSLRRISVTSTIVIRNRLWSRSPYSSFCTLRTSRRGPRACVWRCSTHRCPHPQGPKSWPP